MRVIFAGTPAFAVPPLEAILSARHEVVLVLTQPDRPSGRGLVLTPSPVKLHALTHALRVEQPRTLKTAEAEHALRDLDADIMVVVAYGLILPQAVLDATRRGAINIHASLLPRWRGAAPIQRAVEAGDAQTGVTIMQLDAGLDTGPVWMEERTPILDTDTAGSVHDRLAEMGARLVVETLHRIATTQDRPTPQPETGVTYAAKITKAEAVLDWNRSAIELERRVRAFDPAPGALARIRGQDLKVWRARPVPGAEAAAGAVVRVDTAGPVVACSPGLLRLEVIQRAGGKRLPAADVLRGLPIAIDDRFEPA